MGELSQRLYDEIVSIQYGERPDPYGWVQRIGLEARRPTMIPTIEWHGPM